MGTLKKQIQALVPNTSRSEGEEMSPKQKHLDNIERIILSDTLPMCVCVCVLAKLFNGMV